MLCMALKPLFAATFPASTGIETLNKKRIVVVLLSRAFYMDGSAIATSFHGKMASGGSNDRADSSTVRAHGLGRYGTLESGCHTRRRFCRRRNAVLASAFSAIIVYAYDLAPGKIGMISGLFFGLAFGMAGIGAAIMGWLADATSIAFVYRVCSFLPAIGLLTAFLPNLEMGYKRSGA